jgi:gliding motility-associated-like protein
LSRKSLHSILFIILIIWGLFPLSVNAQCGPIPPVEIDSVSVNQTSGDIHVSWFQNPSPHTDYYVIYLHNPTLSPPWDVIDTVWGAANISYVIAGLNTSSQPFIIGISAVDVCNNPSNFDFTINHPHNTIRLEADFNPCKMEAKLTWNAYNNWPNGVSSYRVWVSVNNGPFRILGTTNSDTTFTHSSQTPGENLRYVIQAVNGNGGKTVSSNAAYFTSNYPEPPLFNYLRYATVSGPGSVKLGYHVEAKNSIKYYLVERRTSNKWVVLDTIQPAALAGNSFIYEDKNADTGSGSYSYRVRVMNTCNQEASVSNEAVTMHLKAENINEELRNLLKWNHYEGFENGVGNYDIYRSAEGAFSYLASTIMPFHEDDISEFFTGNGEFCYYLKSNESTVNNFGFRDSSMSNIVCIEQMPFVFVPNAFMPEGYNKVFKPVFSFLEPDNYRLLIFNRWGEKIYETREIHSGWDGTMGGQKAPAGAYMYLLEYSSAQGLAFNKKGTITLMR